MSVKTELLLAAQDDEEAAKEKPAKKQPREEEVFAGNKNLRSEDQKFREMHDDRLTCHISVITCSDRRFPEPLVSGMSHSLRVSGNISGGSFCTMCSEFNPKRRQAGPLDDMQHDKLAKERLLYPHS